MCSVERVGLALLLPSTSALAALLSCWCSCAAAQLLPSPDSAGSATTNLDLSEPDWLSGAVASPTSVTPAYTISGNESQSASTNFVSRYKGPPSKQEVAELEARFHATTNIWFYDTFFKRYIRMDDSEAVRRLASSVRLDPVAGPGWFGNIPTELALFEGPSESLWVWLLPGRLDVVGYGTSFVPNSIYERFGEWVHKPGWRPYDPKWMQTETSRQ
jgi:hypothetical protein